MSTVGMKNLLFSFTLSAIVTATIAVRQHLGPTDVAGAVEILEMGFPQRQVTDILVVSQSVVARLWSRFQETGRYTRRPMLDRGRCTTEEHDCYIRTSALRNRQSKTRRIQSEFQIATGRRLSDQTICNRLHEGGMNARCPANGSILMPDHHMHRLEFPQGHHDWRIREWESVLFTDESRFHLSTCDRRVHVWRRRRERYIC